MADNSATTAESAAPPSAGELVVCVGELATRYPIRNEGLLVGRGESADVRLDDAAVSRAHARIAGSPGGLWIEDLGGANGTRVDGARITGNVLLPFGAIVEIGSARLVVASRRARAGTSPMVAVHRLVERFAPSDLSLLLLGETGSGKEVLAEAVHARSGRTGSLVRVNCAGLDSALIESALFGHERGAFTGALASKPGLIETAHRGTLLLDEIGEMPAGTQAKLLRVLESREVRRLGANETRTVDVRFLAATHVDLPTLVALGRFREDVLFRLNGFSIRLPPLRERRDEVIDLAARFLEVACARARRAVPRVADGARALLTAYRFPGNVRELRNLIERAALLCEGDVLLVEHLVFDPSPPSVVAPASVAPPPAAPPEAGEQKRILDALARAGGNQAAAADALGMTRRMLGYRMDKLGLPRPRRR